LKILSQEKRNF